MSTAPPTPVVRAFCVVLALVPLGGCAVGTTDMAPAWTTGPAPLGLDALDATLILIGDAGLPRLGAPEPVLTALRHEAGIVPDRTLVVFLGDNVYPDGLPPEGAPSRPHAETVLRLQAEAVADAGARGVFIPGNHDHKDSGRAGVARQAAFIAGLGHPGIQALPAGACAGPAVLDLGARLRVLLLDTSTWLDQPDALDLPDCPFPTPPRIAAEISRVLRETSRTCIVLAHHPLASHGSHGGFSPWQDHLFPLRDAHSSLWIPIPILGTFYTWYRSAGAVGQDLPSGRYEKLIEQLYAAFEPRPPLVYAGGHDHCLQVLAGKRSVPYLIVSGAGSIERKDPVGRGDDTLFASPHSGFMRLDLLTDGRVRLEVVEVHDDGSTQKPATFLDVPAGPDAAQP